MLHGETSMFPKEVGERIMLLREISMFPNVGGERRMFPGDAVVPRANGARKVEEERKML